MWVGRHVALETLQTPEQPEDRDNGSLLHQVSPHSVKGEHSQLWVPVDILEQLPKHLKMCRWTWLEENAHASWLLHKQP